MKKIMNHQLRIKYALQNLKNYVKEEALSDNNNQSIVNSMKTIFKQSCSGMICDFTVFDLLRMINTSNLL